MIPTLFEIPIFGGIPIHSFGLMMATAFLACGFILHRLFREAGYPVQVAEHVIFYGGMLGGLLGAKLYYVLFEAFARFKRNPLETFFSGAGLTWYGGLIVATAAIVWILHKNKIPIWRGVDLISIPLPLGYGLGRVGCHLSGDGDYGVPWSGPWATNYSNGIVPPSQAFFGTDVAAGYPNGVVPDNTLCHPTPMYETILSIGIFLLLWKINKKRPPDGTIIAAYMFLGGLERLSVEFLRINPKVAFGLSAAQLISVILIGVGLAGLSLIYKRHKTQ